MAERMVMMQIGAVSDRHDTAAIEQTKRDTHDLVIASAGAARTSGVTWRLVNADSPDIRDWLAEHYPDDGLINFVTANPGGVLVVATCEYER